MSTNRPYSVSRDEEYDDWRIDGPDGNVVVIGFNNKEHAKSWCIRLNDAYRLGVSVGKKAKP